MELNKIVYNKTSVLLYSVLGFITFLFPLILLILNVAEVKQLVFPISLLVIGGYFYYRIFKAFIHIVIDKPMIEFTSEKYIDNLNGISIKWGDIQRISLENRKAPFIVFDLKNDSQFYKSLNRFKRAFYRFEAYKGICFRTNISFAKGRNEDIFTTIENNYKVNIK